MAYQDSALLAQDQTFRGRVAACLAATAVIVVGEPPDSGYHRQRSQLATAILQSLDTTHWPQLFANTVATDTQVLGDATVGGTVEITSGNAAAQAALVTDAHIQAAIYAQFNAFIVQP